MNPALIIGIPVGLAIIIAIVLVTTPFDIALTRASNDNHVIIVGDSWHYVGNETLYLHHGGNLGTLVCVYEGNPEPACRGTLPNASVGIAEKYINLFGQPAYLVKTETPYNAAHDIVVLFNSRIYCVLPDLKYPIVESSSFKECSTK